MPTQTADSPELAPMSVPRGATSSSEPVQMRAVVLNEPGRPVAVRTILLEPPRRGEVLVRVVAAGVCHSDVHRKSIIGSYYGSADPAETFPGLVELVRSGRLELGDVVSDLIELDGVEDAFERLRRGEGGRSVVILDPCLAGTASPSEP
jgi:Zn-dependent alcohol dehydrogenase